jgi:hypothetical protein
MTIEGTLAGPSVGDGDLVRIPQATRLLAKLALHRASRAGRQMLQPIDLFGAVLEEEQGLPATILRQHGIAPEVLAPRLNEYVRELELQQE